MSTAHSRRAAPCPALPALPAPAAQRQPTAAGCRRARLHWRHHLRPAASPTNLRSAPHAVLSCLLSFVGNLMRVFTSATLVGDPLILGSAATQVRSRRLPC